MANVVNPMAERSQAVALWDDLRSAPCAAKMGPRGREWLDLFAAVAARDASRMAALGARLADEGDVDDAFRAYAVMAGAAGLLASGRHADADRFLTRCRAGYLARRETIRRFDCSLYLRGLSSRGRRRCRSSRNSTKSRTPHQTTMSTTMLDSNDAATAELAIVRDASAPEAPLELTVLMPCLDERETVAECVR